MKQMFLSLALLLVCGYSYAQTTEEEYNYCTKGYAHQKKMGLDPTKADYEIKHLHTFTYLVTSENKYLAIDFIGMFHKSNPKIPKATIMITRKDGEINKTYCLPSIGSLGTIQDKCILDINVEPSRYRAIILAMNEYYQGIRLTKEDAEVIRENMGY